MSIATTTVYLYIGLDDAYRATPSEPWPAIPEGHLGLVSWLEEWAEKLEQLYTNEFAGLQLSCVFDYDITEALGAWLYAHSNASGMDFDAEARRLVKQYI